MFDFTEILKTYELKTLNINYEILKIFLASLLSILTLVFIIHSLINWFTSRKMHPIITDESCCTDYNILHQIHYAAKRCMEDPKYINMCIKLLKSNPSAVNETYYGYTPFLRACMAGCKELISFMLEHGADIDVQTIDGDSPVYLVVHAICTGKIENYEPLKMLVDAGCPVNCLMKNKYTALHVAAFYGNNDLVQWLLLNGADPAPPNCLSPALCARKAGHFYTASLIDVNTDDVTFDIIE